MKSKYIVYHSSMGEPREFATLKDARSFVREYEYQHPSYSPVIYKETYDEI